MRTLSVVLLLVALAAACSENENSQERPLQQIVDRAESIEDTQGQVEQITPEYVGPGPCVSCEPTQEPTPEPTPAQREWHGGGARATVLCFYDMGWLDQPGGIRSYGTYRVYLQVVGVNIVDEERCIWKEGTTAPISIIDNQDLADDTRFALYCPQSMMADRSLSQPDWEKAERVCRLIEERVP